MRARNAPLRDGRLATVAAVALLAASLPVRAQPPAFSGGVTLGARNVDTGGAESKYREDINLDDGVRVLDLDLRYRPPDGTGPIDRADLTANNLGGDPFETLRLDVRKYGAYALRLDRRRSTYFYDDTILPAELASITGSTGGDFHSFDFERVRETAALDITVSPATEVSLDLRRQRRTGDSTTTLDVQRDEFELDRPIDESMNGLGIGVTQRWQRVSLIYEETREEFENTSELFLPGASSGQNTADPAELLFFALDQSYDYESRAHSLRVLVTPSDRLDIGTLWRREDLGLDLRASETAAGTDFTGLPFATNASGPTRVGRDSEVVGANVGWRLGSRSRLIAAARSSELDQRGRSLLGVDTGSGDWRIDNDGYELGAEHALASNLIVAAGWSSESRTAWFSRSFNGGNLSERENTGREGFFLRLLWNTPSGLDLTAAIEDNSIDDPFTLASPTDSRRYKLSVKRSWDNGLSLRASQRRTDVENGRSGWAADTSQSDVRLSYRREALELSAGYGRIDVARAIDQAVIAGSLQVLYPVAYTADSRLADLRARWQLDTRTAFGASFRVYDNRGSFRLERDDWTLFVERELTTSYALAVNYRRIDFAEASFDDYDAGILELAVRLSW
jgi:hypothetical protein